MIRRFTVFRRGDLSATHNEQQVNAPDEPQFEGVVFSDGRVALRWLTPLRSVSVWDSLDDALGVHGHFEPRYGTFIVWHDADQAAPVPPVVTEAMAKTALFTWAREVNANNATGIEAMTRALTAALRPERGEGVSDA